MKGILFKYEANPKSPDLRDCRDEKICGIADPDFWTNAGRGTFVWSVCGPYVRKNLQLGDVLFFLPKASSIRKAGLGHSDYICTGVLVVEDLSDEQRVKYNPEILDVYKTRYAADLKHHRNSSKESKRTKLIRGKNIAIGHSPRSMWFGRRGVILKDEVLKGILDPTDIRKMRIPYVREPSKVRELYRRVTGVGYNSLVRKPPAGR